MRIPIQPPWCGKFCSQEGATQGAAEASKSYDCSWDGSNICNISIHFKLPSITATNTSNEVGFENYKAFSVPNNDSSYKRSLCKHCLDSSTLFVCMATADVLHACCTSELVNAHF